MTFYSAHFRLGRLDWETKEHMLSDELHVTAALMCPAVFTLHPWCIGVLEDMLAQFAPYFRTACLNLKGTFKPVWIRGDCWLTLLPWQAPSHDILRFIASGNYPGNNTQVLKMGLYPETEANKSSGLKKLMLLEQSGHHWSYMINFPNQGRKLFTHNSLAMKGCSRHHQLLYGTFSCRCL